VLTGLAATPRGSQEVSTHKSAAPFVTLPTSFNESGRAETTSWPRR